MKKILFVTLTIALLAFIFVGCSNQNNSSDESPDIVEISTIFPSGPSAISMAKMSKENLNLSDNIKVNYEVIKSTDLLSSKILSEEADLAVIPTTLASKLNSKNIPYKLAASVVWGVLYIASNEDISSWQDLKGEEISLIGRGLTPDIMLRYLLNKNGIDPEKDVKLNYLSGPQELAQAMIAGKTNVSVMPEPLLTVVLMKNNSIKAAIDLQEEWEEFSSTNSSYPQTSLVVKNDLYNNHPDVVNQFLKTYEDAINWTNNNPKQAAIYAEELGIGLKSNIVEKAIPRSNIKFVTAKNAKPNIEDFLKILNNFSPESIGGKLPNAEFYIK